MGAAARCARQRPFRRPLMPGWRPGPGRRRAETPPGTQAQADWVLFPDVWVGGRQQALLAFEMQLSWSRYPAVVWSRRKHELACL